MIPNIAFITYIKQLDRALENCDIVLDVGCGSNSPLQFIKRKVYSVGVDGYAPLLKESKNNGIHSKVILMDIYQLGKKFKEKSFDAVIALDVIEHLPKKEGHKLIDSMEKIAIKKVIIFTPNGFVSQFDEKNKLQTHLSGWTVDEFRERGYSVRGMYGWKNLRKEEAELRYRPKIISGIISELTHYLFTQKHPEHAFALFAEKNLN